MLTWIGVGIVCVLGGLYLWGRILPEAHMASVEETIPARRDEVFARIRDFARYPEWRPDVKSIRIVDETRFVEDRTPFRVVDAAPLDRLVVAIDSDDLAFAGTWTYQLEESGSATRSASTKTAG